MVYVAEMVQLAVCGGYTRTARSARPGSSRNLAFSRPMRRRHRGKEAGYHEAEETSMGRGPQCGTYSQPSEPMAGQAHGAQVSAQIATRPAGVNPHHRDALGSGNPSF